MTDEINQVIESSEGAEEQVSEAVEEQAVDEYAEEAKTYGWVDAEDFSGDGNHMSAEAFMTRGPGTSRKSQAENAALKKQLSSMETDFDARFKRMEAANQARMDAELETRMAKIAKQKLAAVEDGDVDAYKALEAEELTKVAKPTVDGLSPEEQGAIESWIEKNQWFKEDRAASQTATHDYDTFKSRGLSPAEALEKVTERARVRHPFLFDAPAAAVAAKQTVAAVDGGGLSRSATGKKGWGDIPVEDRKLVARQIQDGEWDALAAKSKVTPQAAFAESYWSQDNA